MTPLATLILALNVCCDMVGQLAFKKAAVVAGHLDGFERWKAMFTHYWLWLGVFTYVFEFVLWLGFLSLVPLSVGVLVGSVNILAVMIGGRVFFGERLTPIRTTAIALISIGVALVGWT